VHPSDDGYCDQYETSVVALMEVPAQGGPYGIVKCRHCPMLTEGCTSTRMVEKPNVEEAPSNLDIGRYILTPAIFDA
jgi:UTP-glucose-1-phosphate uridylyltransferase